MLGVQERLPHHDGERLADLYPEDWVKRGHDLGTLTLLAERYRSLESFLAEVALDPVDKADAEANEQEDEHLVLSTVHSAKGLEWDAVFVLHLADGFFPSGYSLNDAEQLEEERRLFYVAITRARKQLTLLRPRYLRQVRGPTLGPGCALLDELTGLDHLVRRESFSAVRGNAWSVDPEADELARIARLLGHFGEG